MYTVDVPYTEMRTGTRTVAKKIWKEIERKYPVTHSLLRKEDVARRPSCKCFPVTRTRSVTVDRGHWETVLDVCDLQALVRRVPGLQAVWLQAVRMCKPCLQTVCPVAVAVCSKRVWVPKTGEEGGILHG